MIYVDTNVLLSLLVEDEQSGNAEAWYQSQPGPFAISHWAIAEFFGVVNLRQRKGEIKPTTAATAIAALEVRAEHNYIMLPVSNETTALAASWLRNPNCSLQTGDALHLAIASMNGATAIATFDGRFAKAAAKLRLVNIKVTLIPDVAHKAEQKRAAYRVTAKKPAGKTKRGK